MNNFKNNNISDYIYCNNIEYSKCRNCQEDRCLLIQCGKESLRYENIIFEKYDDICIPKNISNEEKEEVCLNFDEVNSYRIFNECNKIPKVAKAIEYLERTDKKYSSDKIVDNVIELYSRKSKEKKSEITKLILENKFLDLNWEIIFDDSSDKTPNMSQIKILVKFSYLNLSNLKKEELNLILNEDEFNKMLLELDTLQKGL